MPLDTVCEEPSSTEEPLGVWEIYWQHAMRFDAELEKDWNSDLDVLLVVVGLPPLRKPMGGVFCFGVLIPRMHRLRFSPV